MIISKRNKRINICKKESKNIKAVKSEIRRKTSNNKLETYQLGFGIVTFQALIEIIFP